MEMMDEKILRILSKRGRVTIPQEVRMTLPCGQVTKFSVHYMNRKLLYYMARGDVVSFAVISEDSAIVRRERICDKLLTMFISPRLNEIAEPPQMIKLLVQAMHVAENTPASQRAFEVLTGLSPPSNMTLWPRSSRIGRSTSMMIRRKVWQSGNRKTPPRKLGRYPMPVIYALDQQALRYP